MVQKLMSARVCDDCDKMEISQQEYDGERRFRVSFLDEQYLILFTTLVTMVLFMMHNTLGTVDMNNNFFKNKCEFKSDLKEGKIKREEKEDEEEERRRSW